MAKPKLTPQTPGELPDESELTNPEVEADQPVATTETNMEASEPVTSAPAPGELPDESEIDPAAIERPVLSRQGWVVPKWA